MCSERWPGNAQDETMTKHLIPLLSVVLLGSCGGGEEAAVVPAIEGEWSVVWLEGYDHETLTIRAADTLSKTFVMDFDRRTDVGGPTVQKRSALFVDGGLLLDKAYEFCGSKYAAFSLEYEGDDLVLVPYPNPGALLDSGDTRAVYRRVDNG